VSKIFLQKLIIAASDADDLLTSCDASDLLDGLEVSRDFMFEAANEIEQLESRLAQVERERDAAVSDINFYQSAVCFTCSNHIPPEEREDWRIYCKKYGRLPEVISDKRPTFCSGYNWRGVCPENTKEEEK
jgi:predicted metalloendopeptidase